MSNGVAREEAIAAYALDYMRRQVAAKVTRGRIAQDLGLSGHSRVTQILDPKKYGPPRIGDATAQALAKLLHKGSRDALEAAAQRFAEEHPEVLAEVRGEPPAIHIAHDPEAAVSALLDQALGALVRETPARAAEFVQAREAVRAFDKPERLTLEIAKEHLRMLAADVKTARKGKRA